ncbi:hypothetical protein SLE2022_024620 [Rubroshorea leprosula]
MDVHHLNSEVAYASVNYGTQIVNYGTKQGLEKATFIICCLVEMGISDSVGYPLSFFRNPRKLSIMVEIALSHSSALADNFTVTLKSGPLWPH